MPDTVSAYTSHEEFATQICLPVIVSLRGSVSEVLTSIFWKKILAVPSVTTLSGSHIISGRGGAGTAQHGMRAGAGGITGQTTGAGIGVAGPNRGTAAQGTDAGGGTASDGIAT